MNEAIKHSRRNKTKPYIATIDASKAFDKIDRNNQNRYYSLDILNEQWFKSVFKSVFANTNSNIESFNATIKRDFTGRSRMSILKALESK